MSWQYVSEQQCLISVYFLESETADYIIGLPKPATKQACVTRTTAHGPSCKQLAGSWCYSLGGACTYRFAVFCNCFS